MAIRYDTFAVELEDKLTPDGFLVLKATPTRAGVLTYRDIDGRKVNELRHPDDVFRSDSMKSLSLKPFTLDHPGGLLDAKNTQVNSHGTTGENINRTDQDCLGCSISVQSKDAIDRIQAMIRTQKERGQKPVLELSAGYRCDIKPESGIFRDQRYDQRQVNIFYNHVALVPEGRAGSQCRIRLDSESAMLADKENDNKEDSIMPDVVKKEIPSLTVGSFRLDSLTVDVTPDTEKLISQRDQVANELRSTQSRADEAEGERDALKSDKDKLEKELKDSIPRERFDEEVKEAAELRAMAEEVGIEKHGEMNNKAIKKALCLERYPTLDQKRLDSDEFLAGTFAPIKDDWGGQKKDIKTLKGLEFYKKPTPPKDKNQIGSMDY